MKLVAYALSPDPGSVAIADLDPDALVSNAPSQSSDALSPDPSYDIDSPSEPVPSCLGSLKNGHGTYIYIETITCGFVYEWIPIYSLND